MMPSEYGALIDSAEAASDLQGRIARFARDILFISAAMLVASAGIEIASSGRSWLAVLSSPSRVAHLAAIVALFAGWRICRGKPVSVTVLDVLDAALTLVVCSSWALLGLGISAREPIEFPIMLAFTHTVIGRSVVIPSSFQRTLVISTCAAVPVFWIFAHRRMPFVSDASPESVRTFLIFAGLWCGVAVLVAALNSRQIFGLRRRIREIGKLGQYTLEEKVGEGGMGVVYRAKHAMLRRPAAIKLLLAERASERDLARFEREVQLTSRLSHPNTISVFDFGRTAEGTFYYVMEFLDGLDLERLVREDGPLEPARVIRILAQVSGSLAEAHALGLIHRDIKPANIILTERADEADVAKVVDFGLVKTTDRASDDLAVTNVNAITGTPLYLAPEAITAPESVDGRADLYALGAVGYFLLTGQHVFDGSSIIEVCSKHLYEAPIPPSQRAGKSFPADLEAIILSCLGKSLAERPASAELLRTRLLACAGATSWDAEGARHWWRERGAELRSQRSVPPKSSGSNTMAIDLRGRASLSTRQTP